MKLFLARISSIQNSYFTCVNPEKFNHNTDAELLDMFHQSRDNELLGLILQRYTLLLFGVCMKYLKNEDEARDAVQQIFLKVIQELQKYKVEYFKSWLYMVAKNHCLMKIRDRQGKMAGPLNESLLSTPGEETDLQRLLENEHTLELLERSLKELNPEQQQSVTLFYLHKKSYQDIADSTGFTMMQVKSHIQNGKRNLKILIERKLKEETKS